MGSNTARTFFLHSLGILVVCAMAVLPAVVVYAVTTKQGLNKTRGPIIWGWLSSLIASIIAKEASWYFGVFGGLKESTFYLWLFCEVLAQYMVMVLIHNGRIPWKPKNYTEVTLPMPLPPRQENL
jgi:FtsH-binding integral membrane protein